LPEDLFAPAWSRLDRAAALLQEMTASWNAYLDRHPYDTDFVGYGEGVYILRVVEEEPPPLELAVAVGEWLYNLRSTLDYLMWATAAHETGKIPPPGEGQLQYPIYDAEDAWTRNLYRLRPLADHHREMLKTMQPFNSDVDANYLGWINRLARIDRHRHLSRMTGYLAEVQPVVAAPDGCKTTLQLGERVIRNGKADVARIVVTPWHEGMTVEVNPRIGIDPEIEGWADSPFWRRIRWSERLRLMQVFVSAEIAVYEYDCTGSSRKAEALTAEYRAECDARRTPAKRLPRREEQAFVWPEPQGGRPSSEESFAGTDFPPHGPA
jgi:hypothetical protein